MAPDAGTPDPRVEHHRTYFDALAAIYEEEADAVGWSANDALAEILVGLDPPESVLDLACGTGFTLQVVQRAFPRAAAVGVDIAPAMAEAARRNAPGAQIVVEDLVAFVARRPQVFDLVTAVGGLEFVPDLPAVLDAIRALVAPGGHLVFTYEPVLAGSVHQAAALTAVDAPTGGAVTTFRWAPDQVDVPAAGWTTVSHATVVAYERDGLPVTYGVVHARRYG
jgi:trans-aconitate methyltransferase